MSLLPALVATCGSAAAGISDVRTGLIPDRITRLTAVLACVCAAASGDARAAFLGSLCAGGALFALYALTRGRGLGFGDVKLGLAIGAGFGPAGALAAIGTSFVLGGAYAGWLLARRRVTFGATIPFGPFLAAGSLVTATACAMAGTRIGLLP